jgi:metal-responsive CopG/Arc/MetJ family transcriptional regulator
MSKQDEKNRRLPITLKPEDRAELEKASEQSGATMSEIVRRSLREYLDRHHPKAKK